MIADCTILTSWESEHSFPMIWWKTQSRSRISESWLQRSSTPVLGLENEQLGGEWIVFYLCWKSGCGFHILAHKLPGHRHFFKFVKDTNAWFHSQIASVVILADEMTNESGSGVWLLVTILEIESLRRESLPFPPLRNADPLACAVYQTGVKRKWCCLKCAAWVIFPS